MHFCQNLFFKHNQTGDSKSNYFEENYYQKIFQINENYYGMIEYFMQLKKLAEKEIRELKLQAVNEFLYGAVVKLKVRQKSDQGATK